VGKDAYEDALRLPGAGVFDITGKPMSGWVTVKADSVESTEELRAWVKTDLSGSVDTNIYMYFGNSDATNQQNAAGVWSSNYVGVYHLGESPTGAAGELADSSGSGNAYLSGTTDRIDVMSSGSGDVHGLGMQARLADVHASGSGKVEVCVTGRLEAYVSGSGDIEYGCHPDTVLPHDSGSGDIRPD
jgi:hypothetical protein